jgi:hypothetical protein
LLKMDYDLTPKNTSFVSYNSYIMPTI